MAEHDESDDDWGVAPSSGEVSLNDQAKKQSRTHQAPASADANPKTSSMLPPLPTPGAAKLPPLPTPSGTSSQVPPVPTRAPSVGEAPTEPTRAPSVGEAPTEPPVARPQQENDVGLVIEPSDADWGEDDTGLAGDSASDWTSSGPVQGERTPSTGREVSDAMVEIRAAPTMPTIPPSKFWGSIKYTLSALRARWRIKKIIDKLSNDSEQDTESLDATLRRLGETAREQGIVTAGTKGDNESIDAVEARVRDVNDAAAEAALRRGEELTNYEQQSQEWESRISALESSVRQAEERRANLQSKKRELLDQTKDLERRAAAYEKTARQRESEKKGVSAAAAASLDQAAAGLRDQADGLMQVHAETQQQLDILEGPLSEAENHLESERMALADARAAYDGVTEDHRNRVEALDAQAKQQENARAELETERLRLLSNLGTLLNLERPNHDAFTALFRKVDGLKSAISSRGREIDRLDNRRSGYDRETLLRGTLLIGAALLVVIVGVVVLLTLL